jgi:hypothetical protein
MKPEMNGSCFGECPLLAQSGHPKSLQECPLLAVKRTLIGRAAMSAYDPKRTSALIVAPSVCSRIIHSQRQ